MDDLGNPTGGDLEGILTAQRPPKKRYKYNRATGRPNGRPKGSKTPRLPNFKSLLGPMPSIEEAILKDPAGYDPAVGDKMLALAIRIQWERFLWSEDIDVAKKAAVGVQIAQHIEGSRSNIWVKDQTKYPGTIEDLHKEQTAREANIARILKYIKKPGQHNPTAEEVTEDLAVLNTMDKAANE